MTGMDHPQLQELVIDELLERSGVPALRAT